MDKFDSMNISTNLLARIPLFSDFPPEELDGLRSGLDTVQLNVGEILFQEGDPGECMYIVADGYLEIVISPGAEEELLLNVMREGEYFGEMSLLQPGGLRTTSARARSAVTLLSMSRAQFNTLLQAHPSLARSMINVLGQRLINANDVKSAQERLIERKRLERELEVASEIQLSILPDVLPSHTGYDFGARIQSARQVGGDFYDVFELGKNRFGVVIGDVADKGIPSAIFMARTHALVVAEANSGFSPGEVLRKVNKHLTRLESSTQFVTALYGVLNVETGEFSYARAGSEPPLILHPQGRVERLPQKRGMALGLMPKIALDENSIFLPKAAMLMMFTDGMTDCRNPQGEAFGLERIMDTLPSLRGKSAQDGCDHLFTTLLDYQSGSKQDDDVTLVAVHAK
jgi:serine phosphatase RsbU (regulator of sigma subunit)